MSKPKGPWVVESVGYGDLWRIERPAIRLPKYSPGILDAQRRCDELNKLESVRDAAPCLLEVCKTLLNVFPVAVDDIIVEGLRDMAKSAIQKAEGGAQ